MPASVLGVEKDDCTFILVVACLVTTMTLETSTAAMFLLFSTKTELWGGAGSGGGRRSITAKNAVLFDERSRSNKRRGAVPGKGPFFLLPPPLSFLSPSVCLSQCGCCPGGLGF